MATDDGFLRAIIADPAADDLRLIYADWLEEQGRGGRAEFIRVQCELAKLPAFKGVRLLQTDNVQSTSHGDGTVTCFVEGVVCLDDLPKPPEGEPAGIGRLAQDLAFPLRFRTQGKNYEAPLAVVDAPPSGFVRHFGRVRFRLLPFNAGGRVYFFRPYSDPADPLRERADAIRREMGRAWEIAPLTAAGVPADALLRWDMRRGFVDTVEITLADWMAYGPLLARATPLERVTFHGKRPVIQRDHGWCWEPGLIYEEAHQMPFDFDEGFRNGLECRFLGGLMLYCFDSERAALEALSRAALAWARRQGAG